MPIFTSSWSAGSLEGQHPDEQAHGEADATEQGDAAALRQACPHGPGGEAQVDGQPCAAEDTVRLAQEQAEGKVAQQGLRGQASEGDPGIGKAEHRHDQEGHSVVQPVLQPVRRGSILLVGSARHSMVAHPGEAADPAS